MKIRTLGLGRTAQAPWCTAPALWRTAPAPTERTCSRKVSLVKPAIALLISLTVGCAFSPARVDTQPDEDIPRAERWLSYSVRGTADSVMVAHYCTTGLHRQGAVRLQDDSGRPSGYSYVYYVYTGQRYMVSARNLGARGTVEVPVAEVVHDPDYREIPIAAGADGGAGAAVRLSGTLE